MAYIIAQPCIGTKDTACVVVCPVDCIHPTKDEPNFAAEEMLYIDPDTCIDCNLCVDECPVTAIFPQADLPAEWMAFIEKRSTDPHKLDDTGSESGANERTDNRHKCVSPIRASFVTDRQDRMCDARAQITRGIDCVSGRPAQTQADDPD